MRIPSGALYLVRRLTGALTTRAAWMIPRRWFWIAFVLGALVMLAAPEMAKANNPGGILTATSITGASRTSTGLSGTLNAVLVETERRAYHQAAVSIPWGTLGAAARAGARGVSYFLPYAGMALTAAQLYGWAKDGDWFNLGDGNPGEQLPGGVETTCVDSTQVDVLAMFCTPATNPMRLEVAVMGRSCPMRPGSKVTAARPAGYRMAFDCTYPNGDLALTQVSLLYEAAPAGAKDADYRAPTQVTDAQMAEAIASDPSNYTRMLHDVHGVPYQFPEVRMALGGMAAGIGNATGTTPSLGGQEVNPNEASPNDPAPQPSGQGSELPAFCEWAGVVCDFITWYKDEGEPLQQVEVPFEEEEITMSDWSSGQSGGSCPAPESVQVMGEGIEFSYQPLCDFVGYLYWVIIAGASIYAGFIIAGLRGIK